MSTAQQSFPSGDGGSATEPIEAVAAYLAGFGARAKGLRRLLALLVDGPHPLAELVRRTALPRRTVEELLAAAGADVDSTADSHRLLPETREGYRQRFALEVPDEPGNEDDVLDLMCAFVSNGPRPEQALDHVTATPETALRRARWLCERYDLRGARLLCLGDHDLTSLAVALVEPAASVTVVDLDERVLGHIDRSAAEHDLAVRTRHADLRFGLPLDVRGWADLVFTDPPYTPEGIGLFATRAASCLADANGRILIAYGYSDRSPALGHKVQSELLRLGLVFEAILPDFHRYFGAQAIGSASDLYVCQPTSTTRKLSQKSVPAIYTHGPQSVETGGGAVSETFLRGVAERVGSAVAALDEPGWDRPLPTRDAAFDLRADPGPWLARMLLACNSERVGFVVGNNHPDIVNEAAQRALLELVAAKYDVRFHRSSPDSQHAVVLATSHVDDSVRRRLLHRVHGKLGNMWREALIGAAATTGLTKRDAQARVSEAAPHPDDLEARLIDLPRHRIAAVLDAAEASAH